MANLFCESYIFRVCNDFVFDYFRLNRCVCIVGFQCYKKRICVKCSIVEEIFHLKVKKVLFFVDDEVGVLEICLKYHKWYEMKLLWLLFVFWQGIKVKKEILRLDTFYDRFELYKREELVIELDFFCT